MKSGSIGKFLIASALTLAIGGRPSRLWLQFEPRRPGERVHPSPRRFGDGTARGFPEHRGLGQRPRRRLPADMQPHGPEHTPLAAVWITFDSIRVYPACEDSAATTPPGRGRTPRSPPTGGTG